MQINLPAQSNPTQSIREGRASLVNMYSVQDTSGGKTSMALMPTPGLTPFADLGGVEVVKCITVHDVGYFIYNQALGSSLASVTSNGTITVLGSLGAALTPNGCSISAVNDQVMVTTGGTGYIYVISTNTFEAITDGNFPVNCVLSTSISDFFIAVVPNSNQFYISDAGDGTTWTTDGEGTFASANVSSDNIIGLGVLFDQLFFLKETTTEIWAPVAAQLPFATQPGNYFNYGCIAANSVVVCKNMLIWLHQSATGHAMVLACTSGNNPQVVSTDAINQEISTYTLSDAIAFSYIVKGHEMYQLTFPTTKKTWVFDSTSAMWFEAQSYDVTAFQVPFYTRSRANCCTFIAGLQIVGDYISGKLFILDPTNFTEDADAYPIIRQITAPTITNNGRYITIYGCELFMEVGQGLVSGQGSNPQVMLQVSRDGGFTFSPARVASAGQLGQFRQRVRWNMLGIARDFVLTFTCTDPILFIVLGCQIDVEVEAEDPQSYKLGIRQ